MLIALALFFLWIIFNGKLTLEIVLFGLVIAPALAWFVQRFVTPGLTNKKQMLMLRQLPGYIRYAWLLIKEITLANFAAMRLILTDRDIVVPKLTIHHTSLKTTPARIILADCITLTPGTITVNLNKDEYLVHCLDESLEDGVFHSEFEKRLLLKESQWEERMKH